MTSHSGRLTTTAGIDRTIIGIITANVVIALGVMLGQFGMGDVLWIYWTQSVVIGIMYALRMLYVARHSQTSNQQQRIALTGTGLVMMGVFLAHYGMFHVVYAIFLAAMTAGDIYGLGGVDIWSVLIGLVMITLYHVVAYREWTRVQPPSQFVTTPEELVQKLAHIMVQPYKRIIPMHVIIVLGPIAAVLTGVHGAMIAFIALKTIVEVQFYRHEQPADSSAAR